MILRRIFKGIPDLGPWVSAAEMLAALATVAGTLVALKLVPNPFAAAAQGGIISGIVTDAKTGGPVPEATIQVIDSASNVIAAESIPDAKGNWKETVKPGTYRVNAVCDGYRPTAKCVCVMEGKCRVVRLAIPKAQASASAPAPGPAPVYSGYSAPPSSPRSYSGASDKANPSPQASAKSKRELVGEQLALSARLLENNDTTGAVDALVKGLEYDPSDGRLYAKIVMIQINEENLADAKQWAEEGRQKSKKNLAELKNAVEQLRLSQ